MKITFFGSSITSAYWNGAATYYRGMCQSLHRMGHSIVFVEQDIYDRQQNRDMPDNPTYAKVVIVHDLHELDREIERASESDLVVKCSGVGRYDDYLEKATLDARGSSNRTVFWDVDAPATLDRAGSESDWAFRELIPRYDAILTYGGGPKVEEGYARLGAQNVELIYNALDPETHHPEKPDPEYWCDLLFIGNRLPDREERVGAFFVETAEQCPGYSFILGGQGWADARLPPNVRYIGHVPTSLHNLLNSSARLVLNVTRQAMADYGYSPPTRVFEAAGAGACLVTDRWDGIECFLEPDTEILVASSSDDVGRYLRFVHEQEAREIGERARMRILAQHTYHHRGQQLQGFFEREFGWPATAC